MLIAGKAAVGNGSQEQYDAFVGEVSSTMLSWERFPSTFPGAFAGNAHVVYSRRTRIKYPTPLRTWKVAIDASDVDESVRTSKLHCPDVLHLGFLTLRTFE